MQKIKVASLLKAGLIVGTLDLTGASIQYYLRTGKGPVPILKYIAGAIFPKDALPSPVLAAIGLLMHYGIAMIFTIFFFWLTAKKPDLLKHRLVTGLLFGALIWTIMNLVAVPLTRVNQAPFTVSGVLVSMGILIVCIGLPLALWLRPKAAIA